MTSRREFIRIGLAATALPLTARAGLAAGPQAGTNVPLHAIVYDARFAAGRAFARHASQRGIETLAFDGDMTAVWYNKLYHRWKQGPAAIAGMTDAGALFCFDQLARDQRMRVVFSAEHSASAGSVTHRLSGPAPMIAAALEPGHAAQEIGRTMADTVLACPAGRTELTAAEFERRGVLEPGNPAVSLFSWVIAPTRPA